MNIIFESWKKNRYGIFLMIVSSVCACFGQLFWKESVMKNGNIPLLLVGVLVYAIGAVLMIIAYRFGKLSVLQPILSFNYVLSLILGFCVLGEKITFMNSIGVCIIMLGVVLISGGDADD